MRIESHVTGLDRLAARLRRVALLIAPLLIAQRAERDREPEPPHQGRADDADPRD